MKPLTPKARARLQPVMDFVLACIQAGMNPSEIIDELIEHHGADQRYASGTNQLKCAGVTGQATCNTSAQLLASWRSCAMRRLLTPEPDTPAPRPQHLVITPEDHRY